MRLFSLLLCVMGLFGVFGCAAEAVEGRNRSPLTVHRSRASEGAEGVFAAAIAGRRPGGVGVWGGVAGGVAASAGGERGGEREDPGAVLGGAAGGRRDGAVEAL